MFLNGQSLIKAKPIKDMLDTKCTFGGVSHGLGEAGYDIRIKQDIVFDPVMNRILFYNSNGKVDVLKGTSFVLASAIEEFQMPSNLVGTVKDKSTWARKGLSVFNTVIEPGWNGFLTLELVYHGSEILRINAGQGIAQVLFGVLCEDRDYGDGKYQNQPNYPVGANNG